MRPVSAVHQSEQKRLSVGKRLVAVIAIVLSGAFALAVPGPASHAASAWHCDHGCSSNHHHHHHYHDDDD